MFEDYEGLMPDDDGEARRKDTRPFSHDEMITCDECLRANPPTRVNCLYCGAALPLSDKTDNLRRPSLRQPEKWEEGYNIILSEAASVEGESLEAVSELLRLESEETRRILEGAEPLPLARLASRAESSLVQERLRALGVTSVIVSDKDLGVDDNARLRRVRACEFKDDEIVAYTAGSRKAWRAAWTDLLLLVTGRLVMRRVEVEERRGLGQASEMVDARETSGDVLLLDLYTTGGQSWRITSDSFDFSCLGERKGYIAAQNFRTLAALLHERAPKMTVDESYERMRQALGVVWPPEERTEARGLRRERPGRFNREALMTSDNESQFTRYSRLRHYLKLQQAGTHGV